MGDSKVQIQQWNSKLLVPSTGMVSLKNPAAWIKKHRTPKHRDSSVSIEAVGESYQEINNMDDRE